MATVLELSWSFGLAETEEYSWRFVAVAWIEETAADPVGFHSRPEVAPAETMRALSP
jgi:hypothetical protein